MNIADNAIRIQPSSGNIGLGISSPQARLHVLEGDSGTGIILPGLRVLQNNHSPNVIGGFSGNSVDAGVLGATIGGGGQAHNNEINRVGSHFATIGGGNSNLALGTMATIGGGNNNQVQVGGALSVIGGGEANMISNSAAVISGGRYNEASGFAVTIAGGEGNQAAEFYAVIGGGFDNEVNGVASTVPGGRANKANGDYAFAAGRLASAMHDGAFVWADSINAEVASSQANQVTFRSTGGFRIITGTDPDDPLPGVELAPGGSSWLLLSDRNAKENFAAVDGRQVVELLAGMSILTWNYRSQDPSIRHMGPMAQDFWAAFGLGEDERRINTIDIDGVALAAIQGLYDMVQQKDQEIESLRRDKELEVHSLREELVELRAHMQQLERMIMQQSRREEKRLK